MVGRNKAWFIFVIVYSVWFSGRRRRHLQIRPYSKPVPLERAFCRPAAAGESMPAVLPGAAGAFGPSPYAMSARMRLACFREPDRGFVPKDRRRAAYPLSVSLDAAA